METQTTKTNDRLKINNYSIMQLVPVDGCGRADLEKYRNVARRRDVNSANKLAERRAGPGFRARSGIPLPAATGSTTAGRSPTKPVGARHPPPPARTRSPPPTRTRTPPPPGIPIAATTGP